MEDTLGNEKEEIKKTNSDGEERESEEQESGRGER